MSAQRLFGTWFSCVASFSSTKKAVLLGELTLNLEAKVLLVAHLTRAHHQINVYLRQALLIQCWEYPIAVPKLELLHRRRETKFLHFPASTAMSTYGCCHRSLSMCTKISFRLSRFPKLTCNGNGDRVKTKIKTGKNYKLLLKSVCFANFWKMHIGMQFLKKYKESEKNKTEMKIVVEKRMLCKFLQNAYRYAIPKKIQRIWEKQEIIGNRCWKLFALQNYAKCISVCNSTKSTKNLRKTRNNLKSLLKIVCFENFAKCISVCNSKKNTKNMRKTRE